MSELDLYLQRHYLNFEQFAALCQLSGADLRLLIQRQLVPAASYIVSAQGSLTSYVFGEMPAAGAAPGEYFHPAKRLWVERAQQAITGVGQDAAPALLKAQFVQDFTQALAELHQACWPLPDSFDAQGAPIPAGLQARCTSAWEHFLQGTFGLCVADPSSAASIARKEVLQEKLSRLTENGARADFDASATRQLLQLIADFSAAAMPFSPIEYPVCSRKRLADDLRPRLLANLQC